METTNVFSVTRFSDIYLVLRKSADILFLPLYGLTPHGWDLPFCDGKWPCLSVHFQGHRGSCPELWVPYEPDIVSILGPLGSWAQSHVLTFICNITEHLVGIFKLYFYCMDFNCEI